MWEPVENFFNRIAVRWEDKADSSQQTWDEDEVDEDGFITAIRGGIYYSGKKILTSTDENEFRKGISGTWFQEVKYEDEVDEDGFITAIRGGIYYSGKKILTSTDENEFRKGISGTWFQEVK